MPSTLPIGIRPCLVRAIQGLLITVGLLMLGVTTTPAQTLADPPPDLSTQLGQ